MTALDEPALQRLWSQARVAWQRRGPAGDATIRIRRLGAEEAAAIDGLPWPGRHRPVLPGDDLSRRLSHLEGALRETGAELLDVLERHGGPVEDPRAERRAARAARADLFESLEQMIDASGHAELHAWLAGARLRPEDEDRARLAMTVVAGLPRAERIDRARRSPRAPAAATATRSIPAPHSSGSCAGCCSSSTVAPTQTSARSRSAACTSASASSRTRRRLSC